MTRSNVNVKGFTLIELSIVIVIIGLIVAGVVGGQSLVASAKLRTVLQDVEKYTAANNSFFLEYNEYAGDMLDVNTQAYWNITNEDGSYSVPGDRMISSEPEGIRSWQHLQLAGHINGNYDGININTEVPGITMAPAGYSADSGFVPHTLGQHANGWGYGTDDVYDLRNKTVFLFGKIYPSSNHLVSSSALKPQDAYSLDIKVDNGLPHTGKILADHGEDTGYATEAVRCTSHDNFANDWNSADGDLSYNLDNTSIACRMIFIFR